MIDLRDKCKLQLGMDDNDPQAQVDDTSGSGNHGMLFGPGPPIATSSRHVDGKLDGAFVYDQDTYIDMSSMVNLSSPYDILIWVYCDDNTARPNTIVTDGTYQKNCIYVQKVGASYDITFWNGEATPASVVWTDVGDLYQGWYLLRFAATSSTSITLFVDNVSKGAKTINTTFRFVDIGMSSGPPGYEWKGKIDLLEVYDEILSSAEGIFKWNGGDGTERLFEPPIKVYRGQDGNIDYGTIVAEMDLEDSQLSISQDLPANTIWHYLRCQLSYCDKASDNSPVCVVVIDENGDMRSDTPNPPVGLSVEQLVGGKLRLRWRYTPIGEEISPTGFKIYMDSGSGFDFGSPTATVQSLIRAADYQWISSALSHGQLYRFVVRSYRTGAGESQNTNYVAAIADSQGPVAITGLQASVEEL